MNILKTGQMDHFQHPFHAQVHRLYEETLRSKSDNGLTLELVDVDYDYEDSGLSSQFYSVRCYKNGKLEIEHRCDNWNEAQHVYNIAAIGISI